MVGARVFQVHSVSQATTLLGRWQKRSARIVHEVEAQTRAGYTEPHDIESTQAADRPLEHL